MIFYIDKTIISSKMILSIVLKYKYTTYFSIWKVIANDYIRLLNPALI